MLVPVSERLRQMDRDRVVERIWRKDHTVWKDDPTEIAKFEAMAAEWWDPKGKFRPLHLMNPVRLDYIATQIAAEFGCDRRSLRPFEGLRVLDIGCGGGLVAEPMARLGADVMGADAAEGNIAVARVHAEGQGLAIDYRATTAEALAADGQRFDIVLALEIIEHVADPAAFVEREVGGAQGVLVTAVSPKAFEQALGMVDRGGTVSLNGLPPGDFPLSIFDTVLNGITLRGSIVGTHQDLTEVFALHRLGRTRVLAERRSLEQVNEAFEEVLDGSAAAPRLVFEF